MDDLLKHPLAMNIPTAVAVIIVTRMFLSALIQERAKDRQLWENHLGKVVETLNRLVTTVRILEARLK